MPSDEPWRLEILLSAHRSGAEQRALARDVERGALHRLGAGRFVDRGVFE